MLGQPGVREDVVQKISLFYVFQYQVYKKQPCQSTRYTPQKLIEIEHKILTEIMTSLLGNERRAEPTDIGMVVSKIPKRERRRERERVCVCVCVNAARAQATIRYETA